MPHVREFGVQNPGNFCLWPPESWALESRIQFKNPTNDWNPESKFHWQRSVIQYMNKESTAWNPESRLPGIPLHGVIDSPHWDSVGRRIFYSEPAA